MMLHGLILFGSAIHLLGTLAYVRNTLLGRSKPNRVTFFLWGTIPMIPVLAGLSSGGTWALIPVFMSGFGPLLIFFASFFNPNAYWKLETLDYVCGALAVFAVVLWQSTSIAALAIVFSIAADALAGYPTVLKSWRHPETETGIPFIIACITEIVGLFTLNGMSFAESGFLAYLILINLVLILGIYQNGFISKLKQEFAR